MGRSELRRALTPSPAVPSRAFAPRDAPAQQASPWPPAPRAKRIFDLVLSGTGLLVSSPVWLVIAVAIKLDDRGPVFYAQERVGRYGRRFTSWKFRSMAVDQDSRFTARQAAADDPRITHVGRILRATAMDELPQLINIFRGDMSFVGPRALMPAEIDVRGGGRLLRAEDIPGYEGRHLVTPGLTGIAQVYADRDIPRRNKFRYDLVYVRRQSFGLDLRLIAVSFWITVRGKWEHRGGKLRRRRLRARRTTPLVSVPTRHV